MKRTDLALEAFNLRKEEQKAEEIDGVLAETKTFGNISISRLSVRSDEAAHEIGKPLGEYITIDAPDIKYDLKSYEDTCTLLSNEIKRLCTLDDESIVLVVGLGNRDITPDALGCEVVDKIMITNHMKTHAPDLLAPGMRAVCAIAPGVLGTTGLESLEITKSVSNHLKPDLIIVIDALAAANFSRVSTTFQISDAGITPGSGVGNNREAFSEDVLNAKVIAIGVPTVVDANSICDCEKNTTPMMVTPKDIDLVINRCAKTVANGINMALHDGLTLEEIEEYVG